MCVYCVLKRSNRRPAQVRSCWSLYILTILRYGHKRSPELGIPYQSFVPDLSVDILTTLTHTSMSIK